MEEEHRKEKIQRTTFVLGIFTAAVVGFVVNLFSNMYYDVLISQTREFSSYSEKPVVVALVILFVSTGFLFFLVYDYKNEIDLNRPFFKRFLDYFFNVFWLSRQLQKISNGTIFFMKWSMAILFGVALYQTSGVWSALVWLCVIVVWVGSKILYRRWRNARVRMSS